MRLMECMTLRVKDVDFGRREIVIREGKGNKDRITMLPLALVVPLREQIVQAKALYAADRADSRPGVMLPDALEFKYPKAAAQWDWFWVFPSDHESTDPRSGMVRRHHMYEQTFQRAIKRAVDAAKLTPSATTHNALARSLIALPDFRACSTSSHTTLSSRIAKPSGILTRSWLS